MNHPKILALSDSAFRLWIKGLVYCQMSLTDGLIPREILRTFGAKRADVAQLSTSIDAKYAPLWEPHDIGFKIHDYLAINDSRDEVREKQKRAKQRLMFFRNAELKHDLRARDGDNCRYCGRKVNWLDRKGTAGATYDHVEPGGPAILANLVIACRGCNSRKSDRTPEEARMPLLPVPGYLDQDLVEKSSCNQVSNLVPTIPNHTKPYISSLEGARPRNTIVRVGHLAPLEAPVETPESNALQDRAARLVERYGELYVLHRRGAQYRPRPNLDWGDALDLVPRWDDVRLEKLAVLVLTTDDKWISTTDRGFKIFAMKASWADDKLREWEVENGVSA